MSRVLMLECEDDLTEEKFRQAIERKIVHEWPKVNEIFSVFVEFEDGSYRHIDFDRYDYAEKCYYFITEMLDLQGIAHDGCAITEVYMTHMAGEIGRTKVDYTRNPPLRKWVATEED